MSSNTSDGTSIGLRGERDERWLELLSAAADPIRLRLLGLVDAPTPVRELCARLGLAQPRVSHHLAVLLDAGLVRRTKAGRENHYGWADPPGDPWLASLHSLLRRYCGSSPVAPPRARSAAQPTANPVASPTELEDYLL